MSLARDAIIRRRLARANAAIGEASVLLDAGYEDAAVSRLYYACFYAVSALLARHDLASSKHTGVLAFFNRHFVRPGIVTRELGQFYNDLFSYRQQSDYEDFAEFDVEWVRSLLAQGAQFVAHVARLVELPGEDSSTSH